MWYYEFRTGGEQVFVVCQRASQTRTNLQQAKLHSSTSATWHENNVASETRTQIPIEAWRMQLTKDYPPRYSQCTLSLSVSYFGTCHSCVASRSFCFFLTTCSTIQCIIYRTVLQSSSVETKREGNRGNQLGLPENCFGTSASRSSFLCLDETWSGE